MKIEYKRHLFKKRIFSIIYAGFNTCACKNANVIKRAVLILLVLTASSAHCIFEDSFPDARALGLANSLSALLSPASFRLNPALAGENRDQTLTPSYLFGQDTQQGDKEYRSLTLDFLWPSRLKTKNVSWFFGYASSYGSMLDERTISAGLGTWHLYEEGGKVFDAGFSVKALNLAGSSHRQNAFSLDIGAVMRIRSYSLGFSILNLNSPSFDKKIVGDNAPRITKLGFSRKEDDYTLSADLTRRSSTLYGKSYSINAGAGYSWKSYRYGVFDTLFGLSLGDNNSMVSAGFGYRNMAAEILYSFAFPLSGPAAMINGISLAMRFGDRNSENEYERIFKMEMQYRKDLMGALDESEKREKKLKTELLSIKEALDKLKDTLNDEKIRRAEVEKAKRQVDSMLERQRNAQEELRLMEERRRVDRIRQLEISFASDWENYLRMKGSGAGKEALSGFLQRMINQYQGQGIDISRATMEMQELVK